MLLMSQTWRDIVWCHRPVPAEQLTAILPKGLEPDLFDGYAWVGLVPFTMDNLVIAKSLGWLSSLFRVRRFGEVNVRTYVKGPDGLSGVWFCTLDADSTLAVLTARLTFGLSYRRARSRLQTTASSVSWRSLRKGDRVRAALAVSWSEESPRQARPGLERFLVERYALYSKKRNTILRGELAHEPWQIRSAQLISVDTHSVEAAGFRVEGDAHVLVGEAVFVRIASPRRLRHRR
jgi:uncharacterized protein YqjF (DUF2071 family)